MRQEESRPCRSNVSACSRFREQCETLYLQSANKLQYLEVPIKEHVLANSAFQSARNQRMTFFRHVKVEY